MRILIFSVLPTCLVALTLTDILKNDVVKETKDGSVHVEYSFEFTGTDFSPLERFGNLCFEMSKKYNAIRTFRDPPIKQIRNPDRESDMEYLVRFEDICINELPSTSDVNEFYRDLKRRLGPVKFTFKTSKLHIFKEL